MYKQFGDVHAKISVRSKSIDISYYLDIELTSNFNYFTISK